MEGIILGGLQFGVEEVGIKDAIGLLILKETNLMSLVKSLPLSMTQIDLPLFHLSIMSMERSVIY